MKLSDKQKQAIYDAIHSNLIDIRIIIERESLFWDNVSVDRFARNLDNRLFKLTDQIFKDVLTKLENKKK
jgi:hypothetical protein